MNETQIDLEELKTGIPAYILFHKCGLCSSLSEAKRLIKQGGAYINDIKVESADQLITDKDIIMRFDFRLEK